jgi:hypothetical protein
MYVRLMLIQTQIWQICMVMKNIQIQSAPRVVPGSPSLLQNTLFYGNQSCRQKHPLNSETHDSPAHFKQLPVPNDNSALTILQICVSKTSTSTGLQAYDNHHSSLNDITAPQDFSATTATMTATMTQVPTKTTAIKKVILIKVDKCYLHPAKTIAITKNLFLPFNNEGTTITTNLLLPLC